MKKLLFLFALSLCSLGAWAYSFSVTTSGQKLYYNITRSTAPRTVEVTSQNGAYPFYTTYPTGSLSIPSSVTYGGYTYSVTRIGDGAFNGCYGLTSVSIPSSVTSIGVGAFGSCSGLTSASIPNSVTSIGNSAYSGCSGITGITIPNSVIAIGDNSFSGCSKLTSVSIGTSVSSIGVGAFGSCSRLTAVSIPNSVTSIGTQAFYSCTSLSNVTIGNSVTSIGNNAFGNCTSLTRVTFNAVNCSSMGSRGYYAFNGCTNLANLTIGNNVTRIPNYAFGNCTGLASVIIPSSVTTIGGYAFAGCSGLNSVTIPNSVTSIGEWSFYNCSNLTSIEIPNSVSNIGSFAFGRCTSLTSMVVANGNAIYDSRNNCNAIIKSATNTLISGIQSTVIPNSVTSIGDSAFYYCSNLTNLEIPNSVTNIGDFAFGYSGLTSIVIGNSVTNIGDYAFVRCDVLKTIYNLSSLSMTKGSESYGYVAYAAKRVIVPTNYGSGDNAIHQIPSYYTPVNNENNEEYNFPISSIPTTNFIYYDFGYYGIGWTAKNIVLTDGQDAFESPVAFTAVTATYTREFTDGHRSTLYLPFTASVPSGLEVYDFTSFANNTISFTEHTGNIVAYTPYLVGYDLSKDGNTTKCTITKTNAVFPKSESASYHPVTCNNMTFSGVISRTQMTSTNNYGYSNGFFVQSGGSAHVNPFRCYFTYNPPAGAPQNLPTSLFIDCSDNSLMGIGDVGNPNPQSSIRYSDDVYDTMGRLVRKHAKDLEGLPRGIYIWKGKKVLRFQ